MSEEIIQVVMPEAIQGPFNRWLAARGLHLFPMPIEVEDDLPTYGIGISEALFLAASEETENTR